jgi:hypothetical protein
MCSGTAVACTRFVEISFRFCRAGIALFENPVSFAIMRTLAATRPTLPGTVTKH